MNAKLALFGALCALAGVIVSSTFNLIVSTQTRRSEERRHYRQQLITAAIENWKHITTLATSRGHAATILPLETFLIQMMKFSELVMDEPINVSNLPSKLKELRVLTKVVEDCYLADRRNDQGRGK